MNDPIDDPYPLGASEVAIVLGHGRKDRYKREYTTPYTLWQKLTGRIPRYDTVDGAQSSAGRIAEPGIVERASGELQEVFRPGPTLEEPGWECQRWPFLAVRPDAWNERYVLECKAPMQFGKDWEAGQVPTYYAIQCIAQIAVARRRFHTFRGGYLAAHARATWTRDYWRLVHFPIDEARENEVLEPAMAWYRKYVVADVPPPDPGSAPIEGRVEADEAIANCIADIARMDAAIRNLRERRDACAEEVLSWSGDFAEISYSGRLVATARRNSKGVKTLKILGKK